MSSFQVPVKIILKYHETVQLFLFDSPQIVLEMEYSLLKSKQTKLKLQFKQGQF